MYLVNPDHDVSAPPHTDHRIVPPPPTALLIVTTPRFFAGEGNSWKNTPSFIERDCFAAISATQDNGSAARRIIAKQIDRRVPVRANSVRGSTLYSPGMYGLPRRSSTLLSRTTLFGSDYHSHRPRRRGPVATRCATRCDQRTGDIRSSVW